MSKVWLSCMCLLFLHSAVAEEVTIAVAANFSAPMKVLSKQFTESTGHEVRLIVGSSGKLFAQIQQGAPFDVFLSADEAKPARLVALNLAVAGTQFTYAEGALVLWSRKPDIKQVDERSLLAGHFSKLALANPKVAPYGRAAVEVLGKMGVYEAVKQKLVQGESVAQAFQFVHSYNADLGFSARAQLLQLKDSEVFSYWSVPNDFHRPILQDAVLLEAGRANQAAHAFLAFLKAPEAQKTILAFGYRGFEMEK